MKKVLLLFNLFLSTIVYSQSSEIDERNSYIDETNKQTFVLLGNNDLMYYECTNECFEVVITITEKYWRGIKTSKKQKQELGKNLLEQYNYLFYAKGFKTLTIQIEGIEPISKDLKLNR